MASQLLDVQIVRDPIDLVGVDWVDSCAEINSLGNIDRREMLILEILASADDGDRLTTGSDEVSAGLAVLVCCSRCLACRHLRQNNLCRGCVLK